jgi:Leucine-rich repeat (LRR) protein
MHTVLICLSALATCFSLHCAFLHTDIKLKMRIYVQWLVSLHVLLSTVFLLGSFKSAAPSNLQDSSALLGLKSYITKDPSGALSSWGNGSSACTWAGILCNHAGRVLELHLQSRNQSGRISAHVGNLSALTSLKLQNNHFEGNIPSQLGTLDRLQTPDLSTNLLSGIVPLPLYNLSALVYLAFPQNDLYGEIPSDVGYRLPNLRILNICFNKFHGSIPSSLHNLTKIETIRMSCNLLSGSVPPGLSGLYHINTYNIRHNQISSTTEIISDLRNGTKLQYLSLAENLIEGSLHDLVIGNLSSSLSMLDKGILEMGLSNYIFDYICGISSPTLHVAILIVDRLYIQNLDNLLKYLG